jgi:hypothetical protein
MFRNRIFAAAHNGADPQRLSGCLEAKFIMMHVVEIEAARAFKM